MNNNQSPKSDQQCILPYSHNGDTLTLSRPALVGLCRDILGRGLPFRFSAPGPSMSPFIRNGDIVTLAPCQPASCRSGDVVAFVLPGTERLVVHRIVGVSAEGCQVWGDNISEEDGEIPHAYILGRVIHVERNGKKVRFGLGPERKIIALLSRFGVLPCCIGAAREICKVMRRLT